MKALLTLLAISLLITENTFSFSGNGAGTEADPYQIINVEQLQEMNDELYVHYVLMNDIDASETENWNNGAGFDPIGNFTENTPIDGFTGSLDGQDYSINDLYINRQNEDYVGLFGCISDGGYVHNVSVEDAEVLSRTRVGVFVGRIYSYEEGTEVLIINCNCSGSVTGNGDDIGGFCGSNFSVLGSSAIVNCNSNCEVSGRYRVGSFCGLNTSYSNIATIKGCTSGGNAEGVEKIGGFCGENVARSSVSTARIINCNSEGNATGTSYASRFIGGFCGYNYSINSGCVASISYCESSGDAIGDDLIGGFCGQNYAPNYGTTATISNCSSSGNAVGAGDNNCLYIGGFCGENIAQNGTIAKISNCYSTGNASGIGNFIGGFCGLNRGYESWVVARIENCYSIGTVSNGQTMGGFCAYKDGYGDYDIFYCYWDTQTSEYSTSNGGEGKTTNEMNIQSTFETWDFTDIWDIDPNINNGYPTLKTYSTEFGEPRLILPIFNATEVTTMANFTWSEVASADSYWLLVSTNGDGYEDDTILSEYGIDGTSYQIAEGLLHYETTYLWTVKSLRDDDESDWADIRSFTTGRV